MRSFDRPAPAPPVPGDEDPDNAWIAADWAASLAEHLAGRFGWRAVGWHWSVCEHDQGAGLGIVRAWCCLGHSLRGTPEEVLGRVSMAVLEWRARLDGLAAVFDAYLPLPAEDRRAHAVVAANAVLAWSAARAATVPDWTAPASLSLRWFLECAGMSEEHSAAALTAALGERLDATSPPRVLQDIAEDLAQALCR